MKTQKRSKDDHQTANLPKSKKNSLPDPSIKRGCDRTVSGAKFAESLLSSTMLVSTSNVASELPADVIRRELKGENPPRMFGVIRPLVVVLIILLGLIIYWPSLSAPFVFDDIRSIVNNYSIHLNTLSATKLARLKHSFAGNRPLVMLSFALNYYFGGLKPFGYHLVNLIIHLLTTLAIYGLTLSTLQLPKLRERYQNLVQPIAVCCSLLFLLHPVNTQAVNYTVQRMAGLACLFFLASLLAYLRGRKSSGKTRYTWWVIATLSAACAFTSKENSATLPLFIILYELLFFDPTPRQRRAIWSLPILFFALAAYYTKFDLSNVLFTTASQRHISYFQHLLTQMRVTVHYLSLIIFPHPSRLNLDYDFSYSLALFNPASTFFSLLLVLGLIALGVYLVRRRPFICLCIIWFLGNLAIESGLVLADTVFEHRLYLPIIGMLWLISVGLVTGYRQFIPQGSWAQKGGLPALVIILIIFGSWTYQRNLVWADPVSLWQDTANKSPNKARPHNNLANAYGSQGEYEKALKACKRALELDPNYAQIYNNMGMIYAKLGDDKQAMNYYYQAIKHSPGLLAAQNNLANIYLEQGEYEKAMVGFKFLIKHDPFFAAAYNNLGSVYHHLGQIEEAAKHFRQALQIKPSFAQAHLNLGAAYSKQGKFAQAMHEYQEALKLMPRFAEAYYNIGRAYFLQGQTTQARKAYTQALKYNPKLAQVYFSLGQLASKEGNYAQAIRVYQEGILLHPEGAQGHSDLGNAYYMADRYQEAIDAYQQALKFDPQSEQIHNNIGLAYTSLGHYQKAIKAHQQALEHNPQSVDTYSHLGFIYLHYLKQPAQALPYLRKGLALTKDPQQANQLKATIQRLETGH